MTNAVPTPYIKAPQLQRILEADQPCENKLENIRSLLESSGQNGSLRSTPSNGEISSNNAENQLASSVEDKGNANNFEKILKEIPSQKDKALALQLLQEIEKLPHLSWNPNNLEIIINNVAEPFTNIALLIKKIVTENLSSLPIGLTLFIESLLQNKIPYQFYKGQDAIQIRDNLLKISNGKIAHVETEQQRELVPNETAEAGALEVQNTDRKRSLNYDSDDETQEAKRIKTGVMEENNYSEDPEPKRNFDLPVEKVKHLRRSARLNKEAEEAWDSQRNIKEISGNKKSYGAKSKRNKPY